MLKVILALMIAASPALAGDASTFKPLGFSKNGKYYAFAQSGTADGSGFAYASVAVIDVATDKFVASRDVVIDQGDEYVNPNVALEQAIREVRLNRFGIKPGTNLGADLLVRLPTDHSPYERAIFSFDFWAEGGASTSFPRYEVLVSTQDGEDKTEGKFCTDLIGQAPQMLTLYLNGVSPGDQRQMLLHRDTTLPQSRNCVIGYQVQRVTAYGDSLVVGLSYSELGFEGPNVRQMVVTSKFQK